MWLLFIAMVIMPFGYLKRGIRDGKPPFVVIGSGVIYTCIGLLLVIGLSDVIGANIFEEFTKGIDEVSNMIAQNQAFVEKLGLAGLSYQDRLTKIHEIYDVVGAGIIATLFCMSAVVNYLWHNIFVKATYHVLGEPIPPGRLAVIREFELTHNSLVGWLLIYILSFALQMAGVTNGEIVVLNVNLLIEAVFAIQGVSVILYFFHMKKKPRAIGVVASLILWFMPFGRDVLLVGGLAEIMFGLKKKIAQS